MNIKKIVSLFPVSFIFQLFSFHCIYSYRILPTVINTYTPFVSRRFVPVYFGYILFDLFIKNIILFVYPMMLVLSIYRINEEI